MTDTIPLRVILADKGLHCKDLARMIHRAPSTVASWVAGYNHLPAKPAQKIASSLGVSVSIIAEAQQMHKGAERLLCGECANWYPDLARTPRKRGCPVLLGTCELADIRLEKCDWCRCGKGEADEWAK